MMLGHFARGGLELTAQLRCDIRRLLHRSATDPAFRKRLIQEPCAVLEEITGRPLPRDFVLKFVESDADVTIVLPRIIPPDAEIADGDMEGVGGGAAGGGEEGANVTLLVRVLAGLPERLAPAMAEPE